MPNGPRNLAELTRDVDRVERRLEELTREVHEQYVRRDVYQSVLDRLAALESKLANTWLSNRNAILAMVSMIAGLLVAAYLGMKGGGH